MRNEPPPSSMIIARTAVLPNDYLYESLSAVIFSFLEKNSARGQLGILDRFDPPSLKYQWRRPAFFVTCFSRNRARLRPRSGAGYGLSSLWSRFFPFRLHFANGTTVARRGHNPFGARMVTWSPTRDAKFARSFPFLPFSPCVG